MIVVLALIIGLFILMGTISVYGPSIIAIALLASEIAYLIGRLWKTESESATCCKRWVLRGTVTAIVVFAFATGFLQTLDPKRPQVPWLPAAYSTQPATPTATGLEGIHQVSVAERDHLCQAICANGFRKWDPEYFERSALVELTRQPDAYSLRCYYQEMPTPPDYQDSIEDEEINGSCEARGMTGCWWAVMYGAYGKNLACMRPVFTPKPQG